MRTCRVGLVGAGNVAQRHAEVLGRFDDVELVAVVDEDRAAADRLAQRYAARALADVSGLLDASPDAVYVCVPPFAHGPVEEFVLDAGLPMFVEKPLATDVPTAQRIADLAASRDVLTAVGHHWRYLAAVERARELLADRPVRLVNGTWLDRVPPVSWWPRRAASGGPLIEQTSHLVDLIRLLAGDVVEVTAYADGTPPPVPGADIDAVTAAVLRLADGAVGTLTATCLLADRYRVGLEIVAEGLVLTLTEDGLAIRDGHDEQWFASDPNGARVAADRAFIDAVRGVGNDVRCPYPQALATHRVACALAASARTGGTVRLDTATTPAAVSPAQTEAARRVTESHPADDRWLRPQGGAGGA